MRNHNFLQHILFRIHRLLVRLGAYLMPYSLCLRRQRRFLQREGLEEYAPLLPCFSLEGSLRVLQQLKALEETFGQDDEHWLPPYRQWLFVFASAAENPIRVILMNDAATLARTREFLRLLTPMDAVGSPKLRIGGNDDGGYVMLKPDEGGLAYSFGISHYAPWDLEMAKRGWKVYQYDGTIDAPPDTHPNLFFHKCNIDSSPVPPPNCRNLSQIIAEHGHGNESNLILQMDIEGGEWALLETATREQLSMFKQILAEFHGVFTSEENVARYFSLLEKLNETHQLVHLHYNNIAHAVCLPDMTMTGTVFEATYARRSDYSFTDSETYFPSKLDTPNAPYLPDIQIGRFNRHGKRNSPCAEFSEY